MTRRVTVRLTERAARRAFRDDPRWLPWSWIAFNDSNDLLATGRDRSTRMECLSDIHSLFGPAVDVVLVEEGSPTWPLRRAVTI